MAWGLSLLPDPSCSRSRDLIRLLVAARPLKPLPSLFLAIRFLLRLPMLPPVARHLRGPRPMQSRPLVLVPSHQGVRQNAVAMRLGLVVAVPLAGPVGLVTGFVGATLRFEISSRPSGIKPLALLDPSTALRLPPPGYAPVRPPYSRGQDPLSPGSLPSWRFCLPCTSPTPLPPPPAGK